MSEPQDRPLAPQMHHAVMVSSTYVDLQDLRKILIDAALSAGLYPEAMEHDSALAGPDVIESSLEKVRRAAGYVLLIGHRYGQQPPCATRNPKQLSITELEYEEAISRGRASIVIMLGEDYPLPPKHVDRSDVLVAKLEQLRTRAKSLDGSGNGVHRVYKVVSSESELRQAATRSMLDLAQSLRGRVDAQGPSATQGSALARSSPPASAEKSLPSPPAQYAVPAYIGSHAFVGRSAELMLLDDWAALEDQHPLLVFDAIGGSGKSMLTWHWFEKHAPGRRAWAGRIWYSFYEPGASMAECCRHALAYISQQALGEIRKKPTLELMRELVARLRERPWLLVLDGLERVLVAYHRSDAATIADEALDRPTDQIAERNPCTAAHPDDDELLRQLSAAAPSKVLTSSRLMPQALLNRAHQPIPGVRREPLRGLRPEDAADLLQRCGVQGDAAAMQRFLQAHCDGHPLVVGALAGLIVEPFPAAGDFDAWVAHPSGGAALDLGSLDLVQKRNHILKAAITAVPTKGRDLLATLALLHGGTDRSSLEALNPHRQPEPEEVPEPEDSWDSSSLDAQVKDELRKHYSEGKAKRAAYEQAHITWLASPDLHIAPAELGKTVRDLQRRGLLQMGEGKEPRFDLHPVVRGIVSAGLASAETERLGQRVVDHFSQRARSPYEQAQTLQDLEGGFHVVRTLLRMRRFEEAITTWKGELSIAAFRNLLAYNETLALLKPFFPGGWLVPPQGVEKYAAGYLMNDVALALDLSGLREQAIEVFGAMLRLYVALHLASELRVGLANLAITLVGVNRVADALDCLELGQRCSEASGEASQVFRARLDSFSGATLVGNWKCAEAHWIDLDGMGRDWPRWLYRPGEAEFERAFNSWFRGRSPADPLAAAERLSRGANVRDLLRSVLDLRGEWCAEEGDTTAAVAAFDESARLARASGMTDLHTECWLALARVKARQLANANAEAERLESAGAKGSAAYPLARLWQGAGDSARARAQALLYFCWAWADGEPYVRRFDLDRARRLLAELGEPEPVLPPYDPARRHRFDWQDEVEAAIAEIEREKAELDAEEARRLAQAKQE
jgi:hypothetical protein